MLHIKLDYTFCTAPGSQRQLDNPLFDMLGAIHRTGSISKTAKELDYSYRHVRCSLNKLQ